MGMLNRFRINKAIDVLLSASDNTSQEQTQALVRLKQIGKPAVPKLIQALGRTTDDVLTDVLTTLLDNESLSIFAQELKHQNARVVAGIVKVLSQGRRYDPNRLLDLFANPQIPKAELVKVLAAHKEALQPKALLNLLNVVDKGRRSAVFQLIEQVASEAMISGLIPYTQHQDWSVRLHITRTLSRFSTGTVRDTLVHLLSDPHKHVRQAALEGLASMELPVDVGPLCQLLRDPDLMVQSKAIEAIIRIDDPMAMRHLLDILEDESEYVRRAAVEVLNAVGNTSAIKDLLEALRDQDWWVRVRASDALGNIGGPRVVEAILPLIKDQDEFIREVIKRFVHEMRYTRKITHENVIRIYDFVTLGKSFAISMEYFPSHPLAAEIRSEAAPVDLRQIRIIRDICCGLSVAHQASIVHRDLKPQNILVNDDGLVKIVDFGLAAAMSQTDSRLTKTGALMGTPAYMSPEQARGAHVDPRTDIYSLGVIMYEMFTGKPPYQGQDPISIVYQHVEGKAVAPRELNAAIPPELEAIVRKAMAVEPEARYQNADQLREPLEALLYQEVG